MNSNINLQIEDDSGIFKDSTELIRLSFNDSVINISELMPIKDISVFIQNGKNNRFFIQQIGIGALSPKQDAVFVFLDPDHEKYENAINEQFEGVLAHEFHHCMRMRYFSITRTLGDALVAEGLADNFSLELTQKPPQPWCKALSHEESRELFLRAKDSLWKSYDHFAWFFGSDEKKIPHWGGYSLGFNIIQEYLIKKPDERASQIYDKPARDIINAIIA